MMSDQPTPENTQRRYPHLDPEMIESLEEIGATPKQWESSDKKAKKNIDTLLVDCYQIDSPQIFTMIIGETGSGKSATANTLIGAKWCKESSAAQSDTLGVVSKINDIEGFQVIVHDTSGSWQTQDKSYQVDCYVIVINLASPRFLEQSLRDLRSLKGTNGKPIIASGRFLVVLTHPDSALINTPLSTYLREIQGDPLHDFLTKDARGRVLAVNNIAPTEYQRRRQQIAMFARILFLVNKQQQSVTPKFETGPEGLLEDLAMYQH